MLFVNVKQRWNDSLCYLCHLTLAYFLTIIKYKLSRGCLDRHDDCWRRFRVFMSSLGSKPDVYIYLRIYDVRFKWNIAFPFVTNKRRDFCMKDFQNYAGPIFYFFLVFHGGDRMMIRRQATSHRSRFTLPF